VITFRSEWPVFALCTVLAAGAAQAQMPLPLTVDREAIVLQVWNGGPAEITVFLLASPDAESRIGVVAPGDDGLFIVPGWEAAALETFALSAVSADSLTEPTRTSLITRTRGEALLVYLEVQWDPASDSGTPEAPPRIVARAASTAGTGSRAGTRTQVMLHRVFRQASSPRH
jgi:hypothetical protein